MSTTVKAYGTEAADQPLKAMDIQRRALRDDDVEIKILYSGVCHSDLHQARNDWGGAKYPMVPGHEIIGEVTSVGKNVSKFKVGETVGVGCMVDSCQTCEPCKDGFEQYCTNGMVQTYNSEDRHDKSITYGGYSNSVTVSENFVLHIPKGLDIRHAAPLLCAGITTWSPLAQYKVKEGSKVAVIGLGGLGHMAIKLAKGLGADVSLFSRSKGKEADAKRLGADEVIISTDKEQMKKHSGVFDLIIDTIPYDHEVDPYTPSLKIGGSICLVGYIGPAKFHTGSILFGQKSIAGSVIGGIPGTQEMLNFCAEKNILPECEVIKMDYINEAYERMLKSDIKYRFVIDMAASKL